MRDVNGLEILNVSTINGIVHSRQTMLMDTTQNLTFEDRIDITDYFETVDQKFVSSTARVLVQIGLRYAWDGEICPDFRIVVQMGNLSLISKQGLDDYPLAVNSADMTVIVNGTQNMRVILTKSDMSVNAFRLLENSFIKLEIV
jgi:hypothetical protein